MSFFPVFMPIYHGGGPVHPGSNLVGLVIVIALGTFVRYITTPRIEMKAVQDDHILAIQMRSHNYPNIKSIEHKNVDCLEKKGYTIQQFNKERISGLGDWTTSFKIQKQNLTKQEFINDCEECNVNSVVVYYYDTPFLRNEKKKKVTFDWTSNYEEELK